MLEQPLITAKRRGEWRKQEMLEKEVKHKKAVGESAQAEHKL
jgi:hypothetical protein